MHIHTQSLKRGASFQQDTFKLWIRSASLQERSLDAVKGNRGYPGLQRTANLSLSLCLCVCFCVCVCVCV